MKLKHSLIFFKQHKKLARTGCVLSICACACAASDMSAMFAVSAESQAANAKLSNAELVEEYEAAGLAVDGKFEDKLTDGGPRLALSYPNARLQSVRNEMLRRGAQIVPELLAFLENEAPKEREKNSENGLVLSLVSDTLDLLTQINDPRAAPVALRVLEGWDGKANKEKQRAALHALERLTYLSFRKIKPHWAPYADSVESSDIMDAPHAPDACAAFAKLYKKWMAGEGKDASQWLEIARRRARQLLAGDDYEQVYCAATFLRPSAGRDDNPDATLARLAEIVGRMKKRRGGYELEGKPVPVHYGNWTQMIADYGPRARSCAATLLRIQKEQGMNYWFGYAQLRKVGGVEIMSHLFEALPKSSAQKAWPDSQRKIRFGIDRWAGRVFDSDAERLAWWKANKEKSPEEWLSANLYTLNEQVASGKLWAWSIAIEVLPDMPGRPTWGRINKWDDSKEMPGEPFHAEWLGEHRKELRYDANTGCFRLAHLLLAEADPT